MRYLFFDIECAKTYGTFTPICNFGYVIVDDYFNIIEKKDLLINPNTSFKLTGRAGRPDVTLHYSIEEYQRSPKFYEFYLDIKALLTQKDTIVMNHAVVNDLLYLSNELKRYKLPFFDFEAYDTLDFYIEFDSHNKNKKHGLNTVIQDLGLDEFIEHKADEDACASMRSIQKICEELDISVLELIKITEVRSYKFNDIYNHDKKTRKKKRTNTQPVNNIEIIGDYFEGKKFSIARVIDKDSDSYDSLLRIILSYKGTYTSKVSESNILIYKDSDICPKVAYALDNMNLLPDFEMIEYQNFLFQVIQLVKSN